MDDEKLVQFMAITGLDAGPATEILEAYNYDVDKATEFYLGDNAKPNPPPMTSRNNVQGRPPIREKKPTTPDIIMPEKGERFAKAREQGRTKNRWLCVYVSESPISPSPLASTWIRDLMNMNFLGLEITLEEPDGRWFVSNYGAKDLPIIAIIDPETGEMMETRPGFLADQGLAKYLKDFLRQHSQKGVPIEDELDSLIQYELQEDSESDEPEDEGPKISFVLLLPNGKRNKLEIGQNLGLDKLLNVVSRATGHAVGSFRLERTTSRETLDDLHKKIADLDIKNSAVRLVLT